MKKNRRTAAIAAMAFAAAVLSGCDGDVDADSESPPEYSGPAIRIEKQGAFAVGGRVLGDPNTSSLHCDHGVVEYQIPVDHRAVNLLMWHSASAVAWQNRWDGGDGFQSIFAYRGFPVYVWDGPRVGRANWGCVATDYAPGEGRDQSNFVAWRFGTAYPNWFEGVQFPKDDPWAWDQAMRARYQEFDTIENAQLESDAAAVLADQIGPTVEESRRWVELVNAHGGKAQILMLADEGLVGNTHIPFADMNNVSVADLLSEFLHDHGLDARASDTVR